MFVEILKKYTDEMLPDLDETKGAALGIVRLWSEYRQVNTFCIFSDHNIVLNG